MLFFLLKSGLPQNVLLFLFNLNSGFFLMQKTVSEKQSALSHSIPCVAVTNKSLC